MRQASLGGLCSALFLCALTAHSHAAAANTSNGRARPNAKGSAHHRRLLQTGASSRPDSLSLLTRLSPETQLIMLSSLFNGLGTPASEAGTPSDPVEAIAQPAFQSLADGLSTLSTTLRQAANSTK
jgi:hypothetical protein